MINLWTICLISVRSLLKRKWESSKGLKKLKPRWLGHRRTKLQVTLHVIVHAWESYNWFFIIFAEKIVVEEVVIYWNYCSHFWWAEYHLGQLKAKIAKLRTQLLEPPKVNIQLLINIAVYKNLCSFHHF